MVILKVTSFFYGHLYNIYNYFGFAPIGEVKRHGPQPSFNKIKKKKNFFPSINIFSWVLYPKVKFIEL